jgi:tellurite resistance protein TehA-like permease
MAGAWFTECELPPDAFAVVMATGIVSVAADYHGYWRLGIALSTFAAVAFVALGLGFLARTVNHPAGVAAPVDDPGVALRRFAFVAACAVLDVRWAGNSLACWLLGGLTVAAWLFLAPLAVVGVRSRPTEDLRGRARGAWLLPSVATAGLATAVSNFALHLRMPSVVVIAVLAWLAGMVVYLVVTWLIAWRALAAPFVPAQVTPDSWILMGALAITTLAGDHILAAVHALHGSTALAAWARPVTLVAWALASSWIPLLLYAALWRVDHVPGSLRYQAAWWAAVFPLGMYSAASAATAAELHMPALRTLSLVFFWIACTVWTLVAIGLLRSGLGYGLRSRHELARSAR